MTLIGDLLHRPVVTCGPDCRVEEAVERLRSHDISGMPVVDAHGDLLGVLSASDILHKPDGTTVGELMSSRCLHVGRLTTLRQAAQMMAQERVHRLVVTDGYRKVIGVLTSLDLVGFLARLPEKTTSSL